MNYYQKIRLQYQEMMVMMLKDGDGAQKYLEKQINQKLAKLKRIKEGK
ncbi:hypothetical protein GM3708_1444 [Geminocystis sp. NIES-3708]|nr:hypothetical protein GM3708_1444 [Geminocystis sp. NIES-3708]